ncbi:MAG: hypothetical protein WBH36_05665, partial [Syntrophobacteria bacterium]
IRFQRGLLLYNYPTEVKSPAPNLRVSGVIQVPGVRFRVSVKKNKKLEPVGAKRKSRLKRSGSGEH